MRHRVEDEPGLRPIGQAPSLLGRKEDDHGDVARVDQGRDTPPGRHDLSAAEEAIEDPAGARRGQHGVIQQGADLGGVGLGGGEGGIGPAPARRGGGGRRLGDLQRGAALVELLGRCIAAPGEFLGAGEFGLREPAAAGGPRLLRLGRGDGLLRLGDLRLGGAELSLQSGVVQSCDHRAARHHLPFLDRHLHHAAGELAGDVELLRLDAAIGGGNVGGQGRFAAVEPPGDVATGHDGDDRRQAEHSLPRSLHRTSILPGHHA
ncbi:hypothetical protein ROMU108268_19910 [Roseomonas mucosa]